MLRSLADWSGGLSQTEHSILDAYIYAMDKAEHFIYIEVCDTAKIKIRSCIQLM